MKIAVIGHVRFPIARPFMGGMEAHCWHLCRGLRAIGVGRWSLSWTYTMTKSSLGINGTARPN